MQNISKYDNLNKRSKLYFPPKTGSTQTENHLHILFFRVGPFSEGIRCAGKQTGNQESSFFSKI